MNVQIHLRDVAQANDQVDTTVGLVEFLVIVPSKTFEFGMMICLLSPEFISV